MYIRSIHNDLYLSDDDLELILHQPNLSFLTMRHLYILDRIGSSSIYLKALRELELVVLTTHTMPSSVTGLCKLLESCPLLETLKLKIKFSDDVEVTPAIPQISHMSHLTH